MVKDIFVRTFKKIILILAMVVVVLVSGMFYAPRFLVYSTSYTKVDAIIVLLGPVFNARERHARDLMKKGCNLFSEHEVLMKVNCNCLF